jgi:O-antigen ligase
LPRRIQRDQNEFVYAANIALVSFMATVLYFIARRDGLFRNPPTDEEARLALIDQSAPTVVFLLSISIAVVVSGSVARYFWLGLLVIGSVSGNWTNRRRRQERRLLGLPEDDD